MLDYRRDKSMGKRPYNEARAEANARYDEKTYQLVGIKLRKEDDADILRSIEEAKAKGISLREWVRELYDKK